MSAKPQSVSILVVDDDRETLEFLSGQLGARGFHVETARSGGQAVELAGRSHFDLAVCDLKMPLMDGIACLECLTHLCPLMQVIMISGEATVDRAVTAMKKGAYDFLQKPIRMEDLLLLIERALLKSRLEVLAQLYEKGRVILHQMDLRELLDPAMRAAVPLFGARHGAWFSVEDGKTKLLGWVGPDDTDARRTLQSVAELAIREGVRQKGPFLTPGSGSLLPSMVMPLQNPDGALAVFVLSRTAGSPDFSFSDLREASAFAERLMRTVEISKLHRSLEEKVNDLRRAYSDLRESRDLLGQKDKLASLGELVSGLAHEINNPLSAVMGYADLLLRSAEPGGKSKEHLEIILREAERCRNMVRDILRFGRAPKPKFRWVLAQVVAQEAVRLMSPEFENEKVAVDVSAPSQPLGLAADADQLKQVLLNLLKNALQATREKSDRRVRVEVTGDGEHIRLAVRDNGCGMAPEIAGRLFQPRFTTKAAGEGNGLGLCLASDIIRAHRGTIRVNSAPGEGASFVVELPVSQPDPEEPLGRAA